MSDDFNEFWRSLGLNPGATPDEIKKQYRALVNKHHPDKGGKAEDFQRVHHAYKMLTDTSYAYRAQENNPVITLHIGIHLEQAIFGAVIKSHIRKEVYITETEAKSFDSATKIDFFEIVDTIPKRTVNFPYIRNHTIKIEGKAHNIKLVYTLHPHPYFKISSKGELYVEIELEVMQALKGARIQVKTLYGLRTLRIPAGTIPGDVLKIHKHGDLPPLLVVVADIVYPRKQQMQMNPEMYRDLDINWQQEAEADLKEQMELDALFKKLNEE